MSNTDSEIPRIALARKAFDDISSSLYEIASKDHAEHCLKVLSRVSKLIPSRSKILDVGSGTGKPVAAFFVDNGHSVTGVDFSEGMLGQARSQVPAAQFLKAEMTSFEPPLPGQYDVVLATHSLYNLSTFQIRGMIFKFARWLKKDGIVVIGTSFRPTLLSRLKPNEQGWLEGFSENFLGHTLIDFTIAQPEAWVKLLNEAGMEVIDMDKKICMLRFGEVEDEEHQFYITARRVVDNPLHGPFPIPTEYEHNQNTMQGNAEGWNEVARRLARREDVEIMAKIIQGLNCIKVLCVGQGADNLARLLKGYCEEISSLESLSTKRAELSLPFPTNHFDAVVLIYAFRHGEAPDAIIKEAVRVLSPLKTATIIVDQAAPDNELMLLGKGVTEEFPELSQLHQPHGVLLHQAENSLRYVGFSSFSYTTANDVVIDFSDFAEEGRVHHAASLLSNIWFPETYKEEAEKRLVEAMKIQFLYRPGTILGQSVIMTARRRAS